MSFAFEILYLDRRSSHAPVESKYTQDQLKSTSDTFYSSCLWPYACMLRVNNSGLDNSTRKGA